MAPDTAATRAVARTPPGYPGAHLLQRRKCITDRELQAELFGLPGLLQSRSRSQKARNGDRRRAVGFGAVVCWRALRTRSQGFHGQGQLRAEPLSTHVDGNLWRDLHPEPKQ